MFKPVIKWSGSKRSQVNEILKYFPKEIDTYYEPFCGGASVLRGLLDSDVKVNRYVCSDISKPLIDLWNEIKNNPKELCDYYENEREKFVKDKDYYYEVRKRFNQDEDCKDFLFLLRTCANGMPRWNSKGEFNTPVHHGRDGIKPETFREICYEWCKLLNDNNVQFVNQSYENITVNVDDFAYLDPPYANTKGMYYGCIDYEKFWNWLRKCSGNYLLSFDGKTNNRGDSTYDVPKDIYSEHKYICNGNSNFRRLNGTSNNTIVYESLYLK